MGKVSEDSIITAIHNGIKRGIRVTFENECPGSAVILILSGMDTMAYLGMPATALRRTLYSQVVGRQNFILTDGYTTALEQSGDPLHLAIAFGNASCAAGRMLQSQLPKWSALPPEPLASSGQAKPVEANLVERDNVNLESGRVKKEPNEWSRQPSVLRDHKSYSVVFAYFQIQVKQLA